jgi:hypothetical protein
VVYKISNDCVHIWVVQILVKEDPYNYEAVHIENIYRWIIYHLEDKDNDEVSNLIAIRAVLMALNKVVINSHAEITKQYKTT